MDRATERQSSYEAHERIVRLALLVGGTICVALGLIGAFVPILPTTPFLLLAAACYARSSPRAYHWLLNNRVFGKYLRDYRDGRGLSSLVKVIVITLLWLTIGYSAWVFIPVLAGKVLVMLVAIGVTIHLLRIPTTH